MCLLRFSSAEDQSRSQMQILTILITKAGKGKHKEPPTVGTLTSKVTKENSPTGGGTSQISIQKVKKF